MKSLEKGWWCGGCGTFESDVDTGRPCEACGCPGSVHLKAKIVPDNDDEEEVAWELDLPIKTHNALLRAGINTIGGLRRVVNADPKDFNAMTLYDIRNIGQRSVEKIIDELRRFDERS